MLMTLFYHLMNNNIFYNYNLYILLYMKTKLSIVRQLLKKPIKETYEETPHIQVKGANYTQQADLLYLTNDKGYKYALVVVDLGSRLTDVIPLKSHSATSVKNAFIKLYNNGILKLPQRIELDSGSEFKGITKKFFESNNVEIRYAKTGRSRQQALAERRNQTIGDEIFARQIEREIKTNKPNKQWLKDLPEIIKLMNEHYEIKDKNFEILADAPIITKRNNQLLMRGDIVRIILDKPETYFGTKLQGSFRSADIRWSVKTYKIDRVLLRQGYPPMYIVEGLPTVPYTRGQLQLIESF
jgi:hypothetical protein